MPAYCDHISGLTGSLLLGALTDIGADPAVLERDLSDQTGMPVVAAVHRHRLMDVEAVSVSLTTADASAIESFSDVLSRIGPAATRTAETLGRLGEACGRIHGTAPGKLTLDQIGGVETVLAVMGVCHALDMLAVTSLYHTDIPVPDGLTRTSPAAAALLEGCRIQFVDQMPLDLAGAAVLSTLGKTGPPPPFTLHRTGYGGLPDDGTALIRLCLGEADSEAAESDDGRTVEMIETQIDDMNPQVYGHLIEQLLAAGALDAFLTPVIMKKGRPGTLLSVLVDTPHQEEIIALIFRETTTIGVRKYPVRRDTLPRRLIKVDTPYGAVGIKIVRHGDRRRYTPEYDDCTQAARHAGVPLADVYAAVHAAAAHLDLDTLL